MTLGDVHVLVPDVQDPPLFADATRGIGNLNIGTGHPGELGCFIATPDPPPVGRLLELKNSNNREEYCCKNLLPFYYHIVRRL
jgi:hypothetical protein